MEARSGEGLVGSAYRRVQVALRLLRNGGQAPDGGCLVTVHTLRGGCAVVEAGAAVDAAALRDAVARQLGVSPAQQRLGVYELPGAAWGAPGDALVRLLARQAALHVGLAAACLGAARGLVSSLAPLGALVGRRGSGGPQLVQVQYGGVALDVVRAPADGCPCSGCCVGGVS